MYALAGRELAEISDAAWSLNPPWVIVGLVDHMGSTWRIWGRNLADSLAPWSECPANTGLMTPQLFRDISIERRAIINDTKGKESICARPKKNHCLHRKSALWTRRFEESGGR
jgi:hypothetical protein